MGEDMTHEILVRKVFVCSIDNLLQSLDGQASSFPGGERESPSGRLKREISSRLGLTRSRGRCKWVYLVERGSSEYMRRIEATPFPQTSRIAQWCQTLWKPPLTTSCRLPSGHLYVGAWLGTMVPATDQSVFSVFWTGISRFRSNQSPLSPSPLMRCGGVFGGLNDQDKIVHVTCFWETLVSTQKKASSSIFQSSVVP